MSNKDELAGEIETALDETIGFIAWTNQAPMDLAAALIEAGYRKIFDGDCGLSNVKDPTDREASEAWMRWANLVSGNGHDGIAAMKQMLTEFGYRKPTVLGYIVVDRGGIMVGNQHKHRESAQAFADEQTADCKTAGIDWEYRVAEIVGAAS